MRPELHFLRRYAVGMWRLRWYGVACAWLVCVAGWTGVALLPNIYESSARLYVDADAVLTPLLKGLALDNTAEGQLEVMQSTLLSRPNLELVIAKTPLELRVRTSTDEQNLVGQLAGAIKLVPQSKNLFTISYRNNRPAVAYDVVQTIMNIFIESRSGSNRADMQNAQTFLAAQIKSYEIQLRTAEAARADFLGKYVDLLPGDGGGASHLDAARNAVTQLAGQLTDASSKRGMLQKELATTPPMISTGSETSTGGRSPLAEARQRLAELRATETDSHPDVIRQQQQVAQLEQHDGGGVLVAHSTAQPNPVYSQLKVEMVDTEALIGSLRRQVTDATAERDRLDQVARGAPGIQAKYVNLDRDYDTLRTNYTELLARREAMRLSAAADQEADKIKLRIVDPAQIPRSPISPPRLQMMLGVLAAGLAAGVGAVWALLQLDRSYHATEDLRALGLPVLGGVHFVATSFSMRRQVQAAVPFALSLLLLVLVCGSLMLVARHHLVNAA